MNKNRTFSVSTPTSVIFLMLFSAIPVFCSEDTSQEPFSPDMRQSTVIADEVNSEAYPGPILRNIFTNVSPIIIATPKENNRRDIVHSTSEGNNIPSNVDGERNGIMVSSARKVGKFLFKNLAKKKVGKTEDRAPIENVYEPGVEEKPVLGSPIFEVGNPFYNIRQKYIEDSIRMVPPFPELSQRKDFRRKSNQDKAPVSDPEGSPISKSGRYISGTNGHVKSENLPVSLFDRSMNPQVAVLSRNDEKIFELMPLRKHKDTQTVPPFEELHLPPEHRGDAGVETDSRLIITIDKASPRNHAGPDLYPSSIFERELHVPFF